MTILREAPQLTPAHPSLGLRSKKEIWCAQIRRRKQVFRQLFDANSFFTGHALLQGVVQIRRGATPLCLHHSTVFFIKIYLTRAPVDTFLV